jgi:hypothetical protein
LASADAEVDNSFADAKGVVKVQLNAKLNTIGLRQSLNKLKIFLIFRSQGFHPVERNTWEIAVLPQGTL